MKTSATVTAQECVEIIEKDQFHQEHRDGGDAELWTFTAWDVLDGVVGECIDTRGDIYNLLDDFRNGKTAAPSTLLGLGVVTYGWAAPIDPATGEAEGGAPSASPLRRRVRLIACVVADGRAFSRLHFFDGGEQIDDDGDARGPLAEELCAALRARI